MPTADRSKSPEQSLKASVLAGAPVLDVADPLAVAVGLDVEPAGDCEPRPLVWVVQPARRAIIAAAAIRRERGGRVGGTSSTLQSQPERADSRCGAATPGSASPWCSEPRNDVAEFERDGLLELLVGARAGLAVRPPPHEVGQVPEPVAFHVLVLDLDDALRA